MEALYGTMVGPIHATIMNGAYHGKGLAMDGVRATWSFRMKIATQYTVS